MNASDIYILATWLPWTILGIVILIMQFRRRNK